MMLYRFADLMGYAVNVPSDLELNFLDTDLLSDWTVDGVHWANYVGLIDGVDMELLHPNDIVTRVEGATMLQRFVLAFE